MVKQKVKRKRRRWVPVFTYNDKDGAIEKIKTNGIWSKISTNVTGDGKRVYYRCNQVKRRGKQCPVGIQLLYHNESECVTMYKTGDEHVHLEPTFTGINEQSKLLIDELFKLKVKPKRILETLEEKGLPIPLRR